MTKTVENGFGKVKRAIERLRKSRSFDDMSKTVRISKKLSILIECLRVEKGEGIEADIGKVYAIDLYAVRNGDEIDAISNITNEDDDIMYLLNCYA